MSLVTPQLSFLTLRPSIKRSATTLSVCNAFILRLLSAFLFLRRVDFVPSRRQVSVTRRVFWFFTSETTLSFDDIAYVAYEFGALATSWGWTPGGSYGARDQLESYSISVVTHGDDKHRVGAFRGEGAIETGWFGMIFGGDSAIDWAGTQESESRRFAEYLADMMDVTVGKPLVGLGTTMDCPDCGRPTSRYKDRCLFCGAETTAPVA